jgi:anti-sigma regulatory factor (Ser/Thr protein kinase)
MTLAPGAAVSLDIAADPRHLCLVRSMVRSFAHLAGFGGRQLDRIALAVDEACANVIRHAYGGRSDGEMTVTCLIAEAAGGRSLVVRLLDRGREAAGGLEVPEVHDPLVPGGLGLRLMHDIMDAVTYCRSDEGCNVLELALACPPDPATPPPAGP